MAKYDYGTPEYYDFELKKKSFTAFAVQCLMRDEIMGGKTNEELEVMAAALVDADRCYQSAISDLEREVVKQSAESEERRGEIWTVK